MRSIWAWEEKQEEGFNYRGRYSIYWLWALREEIQIRTGALIAYFGCPWDTSGRLKKRSYAATFEKENIGGRDGPGEKQEAWVNYHGIYTFCKLCAKKFKQIRRFNNIVRCIRHFRLAPQALNAWTAIADENIGGQEPAEKQEA
jgi:hypothetical protein